MKRYYLSGLLLVAGSVCAAPLKTVLTCRMDDASQASLLKESSIDGEQLYLKLDGQAEPAFTDMPNTNFVGEIALAKCVDGVLVFALNYGTPYLKGVAVRKNLANHATEWIDFAEKALPRWLYLSQQKMRLVIPNIGYEVPSKFLLYDAASATNQNYEAIGTNVLPDQRGFKVRRLK